MIKLKLKKKRIVIFAFLLIVILFSMSLSYGQQKEEKRGNDPYQLVIVREGDTLWDIACQYGEKEKDLRSIVYNIRQVNQLETPVVYPGQQIKVPKE